MKFWKWFTFRDEGACETRIANKYRQMPDQQLRQIDPSTLTPVGLHVYRAEIERRKATAKPDSVTRKSS